MESFSGLIATLRKCQLGYRKLKQGEHIHCYLTNESEKPVVKVLDAKLNKRKTPKCWFLYGWMTFGLKNHVRFGQSLQVVWAGVVSQQTCLVPLLTAKLIKEANAQPAWSNLRIRAPFSPSLVPNFLLPEGKGLSRAYNDTVGATGRSVPQPEASDSLRADCSVLLVCGWKEVAHQLTSSLVSAAT